MSETTEIHVKLHETVNNFHDLKKQSKYTQNLSSLCQYKTHFIL